MIRQLLILFATVLIWWWVRRLFALRTRTTRPGEVHEPPLTRAAVMVRDPVCGTFFPRDGALSLNQDDGVSYFCSENCRRKFLEAGDAGKSEKNDPAR